MNQQVAAKKDNTSYIVNGEEINALRNMVQQVADFIALYEAAADKIEKHEVVTGQRLSAFEQNFTTQIKEINEVIDDFKGIMTQAGVARWRVAAEQALREGREHQKTLREASQALLEEIEKGCEQLEYTTETTVAQITEATKVLALEEFKQVTETYQQKISEHSNRVLDRLSQVSSWFQWQRVISTVVVAIIASMVTAFIINGQWPWETHKQIAMEREAGQTLLRAWPQLPERDKSDIQTITQHIIS